MLYVICILVVESHVYHCTAMTVDGTITAGGVQGVCPGGGGGAGGSIYIDSSTTISGTGSITANGKLLLLHIVSA
jgi:hypothetical protein